jgi:hypothetical protein
MNEKEEFERQEEAEAMMENIHKNIERHGHCIVGVPDDLRPFSYTVGNHDLELPELLFIDLTYSESNATTILNRLAHIMRNERRAAFRHGELVSLGGKFPLKIVDAGAAAKQEFTLFAGVYYGTQLYRVQQVVLCDQEGRFPGDPKCEEPYASQRVLATS